MSWAERTAVFLWEKSALGRGFTAGGRFYSKQEAAWVKMSMVWLSE